jgi:hypothetical protein
VYYTASISKSTESEAPAREVDQSALEVPKLAMSESTLLLPVETFMACRRTTVP